MILNIVIEIIVVATFNDAIVFVHVDDYNYDDDDKFAIFISVVDGGGGDHDDDDDEAIVTKIRKNVKSCLSSMVFISFCFGCCWRCR